MFDLFEKNIYIKIQRIFKRLLYFASYRKIKTNREVKNMSSNLKRRTRQIGFNYSKSSNKKYSGITTRAIALLMTAFLLIPLILFELITIVSAKTSTPISSSSAPFFAPPVIFIFSSPVSATGFFTIPVFRFNERRNDKNRFAETIGMNSVKRLKYNELIGKE